MFYFLSFLVWLHKIWSCSQGSLCLEDWLERRGSPSLALGLVGQVNSCGINGRWSLSPVTLAFVVGEDMWGSCNWWLLLGLCVHFCTGIGVGASLGTVFVLVDWQLPGNAVWLNSNGAVLRQMRHSVIYLSTIPQCLGLLLLLQLFYAGNRLTPAPDPAGVSRCSPLPLNATNPWLGLTFLDCFRHRQPQFRGPLPLFCPEISLT